MKILYFASLKEKIGKSSEELFDFNTTDELTHHLMQTYPNCFDANIITAVNMEVVNENTTISNTDEIAFYPPVTGG